MKNLKFLFFLSFLGLLSSCSPQLTHFTQKLYEDQDWTEDELKKIQFYVSEDIILRKKRSKGDSRIEGGDIKIEKDSEVEQIKIKKGTPGVLIFMPKEKRFAINFENGNENKYLIFGPNPKKGNKYSLLAKDWSRTRGKITYNGESYYTTSESAYASLLVNLKKVRRTSVKSRTARGAKID